MTYAQTMEYNHQDSATAHKSEAIGLFKVPETQTDIESGHWDVIEPTQSLDKTKVVGFKAAAGPYFTDLANSYVQIRFSVSTTAGAVVAADALSFVNLIAHTLWSKVNLYVSGIDVTDDNRYYPHTAMLATLLGKSSAWLPSGQLEGFYKDTATHMDDYAAANTGFVARKALIVAAAVGNDPTIVGVTMRPYLGAFQHHRLIPDRTEIRLELQRSKDEFALIHNDVAGATIKLESVLWNVRRVKLSEQASTQINNTLTHSNALFPITRFRVFAASFKSESINFTNVLEGAIPTHVTVAFVSTAAMQGSNKLNPFNFQNLGLTRLQVTAAGTNYPRTELTPIFSGKALVGTQAEREYHRLLEFTHKLNGPSGLLFSMADYPGGYALYSFDLTPDLDSGHWSPSYRGALSIKGAFSAAPAADVSIVVFTEVPSVWELNGNRSVIKDW